MFVSTKKRIQAKKKLVETCSECEYGCPVCLKKSAFVDQLADANIPAAYWFLKMKDFKGPENVKKTTLTYLQNLDQNYEEGSGLCYTGQYGTGKTYSICSILKVALVKGYDTYYTSLTDMVSYLGNFDTSDAFYKLLTKVDILAIDEVDSRHFSDSDQAQQYFGSSFERVVRYRTQNNLPILLGTNNASLEEVFLGQYKRVIDSLLSNSSQVVPALGKDFRKK